jgi:transcriptional regulator of acetoin/glycerol metabolism
VLFLGDGELLDSTRLTDAIRAGRPGAPAGRTLDATLAAIERDEIRHALEIAGGDVNAAAGRLGVSRATLYRRMKVLAIGDPSAQD